MGGLLEVGSGFQISSFNMPKLYIIFVLDIIFCSNYVINTFDLYKIFYDWLNNEIRHVMCLDISTGGNVISIAVSKFW